MRKAIIILKNRITNATIFLIKEIKKIVDELYIGTYETDNISLLKTICDEKNIVIKNNIAYSYFIKIIEVKTLEYCIFTNDEYFGPLLDFGSYLQEKINDVDGIILSEKTRFDDLTFAIIKGRILCHEELTKSLYCKNFVKFWKNINFNCRNYLAEELEKYDSVYERVIYRSTELLLSSIPFVYKKVFLNIDYDYSDGIHVFNTLKYINNNSNYDVKLIYDELLKNNNLSQLYSVFHWNYILPKEKGNIVSILSTAIIICLYYEECLERNLSYLLNIPEEIEIYLIIKRKTILDRVKKICSNLNITPVIILAKENKGRDLSALLIEAASIVKNYRYICFLHDKKTSAGVEADIVGDSFSEMLFENLIGSNMYIRNIIETFEKNPSLGVLAPPEVSHGNYFSILGGEWTNNFENTKKLAYKLKINVPIDKNNPPYILSTTFWCRTESLKKLFQYEWKYEDFLDEPLAMDGTLNHAIERIIMYVAQDSGYYSGIVQSDEYASNLISQMRSMLIKTLSVCHKYIFFNKISELGCKKGNEIINFCKNNGKKLYIYGTGGNSSRVADFLESNSISFNGYIVSDGYKNKDYENGKRIFEFSDILNKKETIKILISVNEKLQRVIIPMLIQKGIEDYLCI